MNGMLKKIDGLITKRNTLFLCLFGVAIIILDLGIEYFTEHSVCKGNYVGFCYTLFNFKVANMSLILFLFLSPFLLITYFQHDRIFKAWARFAVSWIGLFIVLLSLANGSTGSGWVGGGGGGILVLAFFLAVYVIVSILIILVQSVRVNGL